MAISDYTFDQSAAFRKDTALAKPKKPQSHFRVHLADGSKHDVSAACADDATRHVGKRYPQVKITKTKLIREQADA
ncbi:MAG: hypothetical protein EON58_03910 [Alphaproteobacteria bacterium]|nr:MAG: hypothetical protein EON58_03910 [Alphaproteobacteria bacterium]